MSITGPQSIALQQRAQKVLPLGVNSNFRFWGQGITPYVGRAKGAYLWDVDGRKYIDYRLAFGPIILGHSFDEVDARVIEEIKNGVLFAMTGELEIQVAEMITQMVPAVEMRSSTMRGLSPRTSPTSPRTFTSEPLVRCLCTMASGSPRWRA